MKDEPQTNWPQRGAEGAKIRGQDGLSAGTAELLRRHRRRVRGTPLAWSLAATLTALALTGAAQLGWMTRGPDVAAVAMVAAAVLLGIWIQRGWMMTARGLARELDERWALRARLESSVELAEVETPAARAQREDALRHVARREPPGAWMWLGASGVLALVGVVLLAEGSVLAWREVEGWRRKPEAGQVAEQMSRARESETAAVAHDAFEGMNARASVEWMSPESEITATSIEEVPLQAQVVTEHGVRAASLELVVNGVRAVSRSLDAAELGAAVQPGMQELRPSLFLDELQVKPFDLVSYRLVAELNEPAGEKVSSALQFVQIRPVRRDVALQGKGSELAALLMQLKAAQLGLLKQNFELARMSGAEREASWAAENSRVAEEQAALGEPAERAIGVAREMRTPPLVTKNLNDARGLMEEAGESIAERENARAAPLQERALALLTELQQFIQPALEGGMAAPDPFRDREHFELPPREETPAGAIEVLVERQRKNNARIAAEGGGAEAKDEQEAIARALGELQGNAEIEADVQVLLRSAGASAGEAAGHLAANDAAAARVPAAATERALDQALAAQETIGRAAAVVELDRLRRRLNAAGRSESEAGLREQRTAWRTSLREVARAQQRSGSGHVARELAALDRRAGEPVGTLAAALAQTQVLSMPRGAALNRAIRPLQRVSGELGRNDAGGEALADLEIASQEAEWLTSEAPIGELARRVAGQADGWLRAGSVEVADAKTAGTGARELAAALERGTAAERDGGARWFNPAEIDPAYRAAVENYFERLSREGRAPQKAKAP